MLVESVSAVAGSHDFVCECVWLFLAFGCCFLVGGGHRVLGF